MESFNEGFQNIIPRGIRNFQNGNFSYANSVLQSLSCLNCIKEIADNENIITNIQNSQFILTKEFLNLVIILNKIPNKDPFSDYIILYFNKFYNNCKNHIQSQNVLNNDPFHFTYFLLQFMHLETNLPQCPNYNIQNLFTQNIDNQKNNDYMEQLYLDFFYKTQNSIISDFFFGLKNMHLIVSYAEHIIFIQ